MHLSRFWTDRVEEERAQPRRLWQSFDEILGRGRAPPPYIDATTLHRYFDDKVAGVRAATAGAAPPEFTTVPAGCELRIFTPVNAADVISLVRRYQSSSAHRIQCRPVVAEGKCGCAGAIPVSTVLRDTGAR